MWDIFVLLNKPVISRKLNFKDDTSCCFTNQQVVLIRAYYLQTLVRNLSRLRKCHFMKMNGYYKLKRQFYSDKLNMFLWETCKLKIFRPEQKCNKHTKTLCCATTEKIWKELNFDKPTENRIWASSPWCIFSSTIDIVKSFPVKDAIEYLKTLVYFGKFEQRFN